MEYYVRMEVEGIAVKVELGYKMFNGRSKENSGGRNKSGRFQRFREFSWRYKDREVGGMTKGGGGGGGACQDSSGTSRKIRKV